MDRASPADQTIGLRGCQLLSYLTAIADAATAAIIKELVKNSCGSVLDFHKCL